MKSLQITVELLDGNPHGVRRSKIQHRPARAVAVPRDQISRLSEFDEFKKPGIYFLLGAVPAGPTIYVGQTDTLSDRLRTHRSRQDWTELVAVTSSDDWMNIAHTRCLESRCWANCQENRYFVLNSQEPKESQVSAADQQLLEEFFEHMICLTRSLGYDFLSLNAAPSHKAKAAEPVRTAAKVRTLPGTALPDIFVHSDPPSPKVHVPPRSNEQFDARGAKPVVVCTRCLSLNATLHCFPGNYILKTGSLLQPLRESAIRHTRPVVAQRQRALEEGQIVAVKGGFRLETDLIFKSPSYASGFVVGGSSNGWIDWKDATGEPLDKYRTLLKS